MANETLIKFGYPDSLVHEYDDWVVLLRPVQITVASLVLACKLDIESMGQIPANTFAELATVTSDIETVLQKTFQYDKINYLLLMMVDKHVHFHVLPRYESTRSLNGEEFEDAFWPGPPDISQTMDITSGQYDEMLVRLKSSWPVLPAGLG